MSSPTPRARRLRSVKPLIAAAAALVAAATFALFVSPDAMADSTTLTPVSITTVAGATGSGQPVSNLAVQDQSGTASDWNKYVEFSGQYSGYLTYTVPATIAPSSVTGIQARIAYRGPATATQTWTFSLYNWTTSSWTALGTNAAAPDWGAWTLLSLDASGSMGDYLSSGRQIRLQLAANNAADSADIDYAGLALTTSPVTPPPTSPSTTPSTSPTSTPSSTPSTSPSTTPTTPPSGGLPDPVSCPGCWHPALQTSWNWVLSKVPTAPYRKVQMYDIDGFNAAASDVAAMHSAGMEVVCYISAGTYEDWRPDASQFPAAIKGSGVSGWPGENWLDVRDVQNTGSVLASIMNARLDMCRTKGFDAVEFDNVDGYTNPTGFPLTASDQAYYNVFLANGARSRGMSAVLKNDLDQVTQLLPYFDMALDEQCNQYGECGKLAPFVSAGKPVFNAEYATSTSFCPADNAANINGVNYSLNLDDSKFQPCR
jgi:hypothetical protein